MSAENVLPPADHPRRFRPDWKTLNPFSRPLYKDLTFQVLAGMVLGVLIGALLPVIGKNVEQVSDIFIDLIEMVTGLIVFCTVTLGIAKVRDFGKVGRIAVKALIYFEVITALALIIGLVVVNILRPGAGVHINAATLGALLLEFLLTVVLFFVLVLWPVSHYAGVSLLKLMRYFREELLLVIGTSSSESVFPQLTEKLKRLGVDDEVVGLVLPTAYSFNHDGTCLFWAATSVFLAQATDTRLWWQGQLSLMVVLLLTSKGGAGSSIPILALTLASTHAIPVDSVALVLGVSKVMSAMFVFANIVGNCVATIVVGKWEKAIDWVRMRAELDGRYQPAALPVPAVVDSTA
jgi:Na+/H+-dicarboxylate symporter